VHDVVCVVVHRWVCLDSRWGRSICVDASLRALEKKKLFGRLTSVTFGSTQDGRLPEEEYTHTLREERLVTALLSFSVPYAHTHFSWSHKDEEWARHCWTVLVPVDTGTPVRNFTSEIQL
jgi:hypothetical protein